MMLDNFTSVPTTPEHIAKYGRFNDAPPGFKEITKADIARSLFATHSPVCREYRQIMGFEKTALSVTLYYMHDGTGYGMSFDYWNSKVRWFRFGCEHQYHELTMEECRKRNIYHAGRCWHVRECTLCGHINAVDTSD